MIFNFLTNTFTLLCIVFHIYNHYKQKKNSTKTKQYPYIFILLSLLLTFEQTFSFIIKFMPFYAFLKFVLVLVICFPYTNMAQKIYKEYLQRIMETFEERIDSDIDSFGNKWRNVLIEMYDNLFSGYRKLQNISKEEVEIRAIETEKMDKIEENYSRGFELHE